MRCVMPPEVGRCKASMRRWYYDIESNNCKTFIFGGCGGNENNFWSKTECQVACIGNDLYFLTLFFNEVLLLWQ